MIHVPVSGANHSSIHAEAQESYFQSDALMPSSGQKERTSEYAARIRAPPSHPCV